MRTSRLDRQLRIEGWNQPALEKAKVGVVGDDDLLASLYVMSASALGINHVVVLAPVLNPILVEIARKLNLRFTLTHVEGFYTHPVMAELFKGCNIIVDLSHYGLANKLLLETGFQKNIPIIRGFCYQNHDAQGFRVFSYLRGREWQELEQIISACHLPNGHFDDGVLDTIITGIVLEETKNLLMGQDVSDDLISYTRKQLNTPNDQPKILVVGSGALGIFVGLGLAYSKFQNITFMDPDVIEVTNLNRQVLFYDAIGSNKAEILSERLNSLFNMDNKAQIAYFDKATDITSYDAVFDCVDNFESRLALSEKCKEQGKILISGGTSADAGQIVIFDPMKNGATPAELLGLYDIVEKRNPETYQRERAACLYRPDPSVIMTNQITAGFMVDSYRMLLDGQKPGNIFYDSTNNTRF
ncbi:MAG: ThiF family adenylyltransferase [Candidatus Desulfatibia sp.]|uniref:ThiF family adenylyltransferase n=1 Tax=Candidatus Desulfatibia sp. TaxID=3101189 RepID=UPI002F2FB21D